ncbi:MAG TPA: hypothetical protein VFR81_01365 [Longimicrobium sp.]|nr:hypothetical protein [Longimicrobium sp.]
MTRKDKAWMCGGVALFAVVTGILVGASASPTAGVMVTGLFAAVAAALSILYEPKRGEADHEQRPGGPREIDYRALGQVVSLFSIALLCGVLVGAQLRTAWWPSWHQSRAPSFPWNSSSTPESPMHALDWLVVQDWLRDRGYTQEQVRELYKIQAAEWKKSPGRVQYFSRPLSEMLPRTPKQDEPDFIAENRGLDQLASVRPEAM